MSAQELAETGIMIGARVGSCRATQRYGTVEDIVSTDAIRVHWDDNCRGLVPWTAISPLGYVAESAREMAA